MIKFELTFFDIIAFNKHFMKKNGTFIQKYLHWVILLFLVVFMLVSMVKNNASASSYIMIAVLLVAIVFVQKAFADYLRRKAMTAYVKKNPQVIGDRVFEYDKKSLKVTIDNKQIVYPFDSFTKIEEAKDHYFAYVNEQGAVIIPKRLLKQYEGIAIVIDRIKAVAQVK